MNKKWFGLFFGVALICGSLFAAEWTVEDTFKVKNVGDVQVSPDGKEVVYTIATPVVDEEKSQWRSEVYLCKSDGSSAKKIADGRAPEWSPDGQWIAYISQPNHLSMVSSKDGTTCSLAELPAPVIDYHWASDSKVIGFTMPAPIQLWTIAIDGQSQPKQITDGPYEVKTAFPSNTFDWSPDGKEIVFLYHFENTSHGLHHADLAKVDVSSGKVTELLVDEKVKCNPLYSPDGTKISCVVGDSFLASNVFILPSQGGQPTKLADTPNQELFFTGKVVGWASNSKTLYLSESKETLNELYTLPLNGGAPTSLKLSNRLNKGFALNASGTHLGFVSETCQSAPEAYVANIAKGHVKRITQVNTTLPVEFLAQSKVIRWRSADGLEIEGLLTFPFNYQPEKKYPLLLIIHGGPPGVFQQTFVGGVDPVTPYFIATSASHDYAILRCNVRGSTGYGESFRTAIRYDLGGKDFDDLMAGVDHVIDMGVADPERLGIMGWSFGGYLTAWSLSQTDRFKAASVGAGISDFVSFAGTTDCTEFMPLYCGGEFWDKLSIYHTRSPICHVNNFSTPTLIQHGEKDVRVPVGQAHQLYHALKQRNVPVERTIIPNTGHLITEPKLLAETMKENLHWFEQKMG